MSSIDKKNKPEFFLAKDSCVTVNRSLDKSSKGDKPKPKQTPGQSLNLATQLSKVKSQTNFDSATSHVKPDLIKKPPKPKTLKVDLIPFKPTPSIRQKLSMSELVQIPVQSTKDSKIDSRNSVTKISVPTKKISNSELDLLLDVERLLFEFLRLIHFHQDIYDHFKVYIDFVQEHNFEPLLVG